jgi:hypothetical protein
MVFAFSPGLSCRSDSDTAPRESASHEPTFALQRDFGTGPVRLTVAVSNETITTAEALHARLGLKVPTDYEAEFPDLNFETDVPGLILTDYDETSEPTDDGRIEKRTYELEPSYAGTFTIPELEIYYHKKGEVKESLFTTEPIEFTVEEVPVTAEQLTFKPARGLVTLKDMQARRQRLWPWIAGLSGGLLLAMVGLIWWARRPKKVPPPPPAHEIALERLRLLVEKQLVENDQADAFFVEITNIVRDYIEQAFHLRAPEQTTEEFLNNITDVPAVAEHRQALQPFLTAADEVKFARIQPDAALIQRTFDTAREFILQTSQQRKEAA